jgi:hypothetical protein
MFGRRVVARVLSDVFVTFAAVAGVTGVFVTTSLAGLIVADFDIPAGIGLITSAVTGLLELVLTVLASTAFSAPPEVVFAVAAFVALATVTGVGIAAGTGLPGLALAVFTLRGFGACGGTAFAIATFGAFAAATAGAAGLTGINRGAVESPAFPVLTFGVVSSAGFFKV